MINHCDIEERLNDYLDGTLSEREQADITRHIAKCPQCARELEQLQSLLDQASDLPRAIDPVRDLWPAIERRILPRPVGVPKQRNWSIVPRWALVGALGAAVVVAAILLDPPGDPNRDEGVALRDPHSSGPASRPSSSPRYLPSLVRSFEYQCMGAGKELLASVSETNSPLGVEAATTVEPDVRLLDLAISEMKAALGEHPEDSHLLQMLMSRYQRKLSLLHQVTRFAQEA